MGLFNIFIDEKGIDLNSNRCPMCNDDQETEAIYSMIMEWLKILETHFQVVEDKSTPPLLSPIDEHFLQI